MSNIAYPPQRPLSVGEILDLSFRIYRATLVRCLLFATLGVLAGQLTNVYGLARGRGLQGFMQSMQGSAHDPVFWLAYLLAIILSLIFYAGVLLRQRAVIGGSRGDGELAAAARRTPAMLALVVLMLLTVVGCFVPALLGGSAAGRLGLAALMLVPLSYVLIALSCAFTVLLLERAGPLASYVRSWRLTYGSFWRLSLVYLVAVIVLLALTMVLGAVSAFVAGLFGRGDVVLVAATAGVIIVALSALTTPFYTAVALAVYGDLAARKEGTDLEQRISATA
jgi:hypothetical protein